MRTNHQLLRHELMKRLRAAYPTQALSRLEEMAAAIEETRAYAHDGERIMPVGDEHQMKRAANVAATVCGQITSEHVKWASSSSSLESAAYDRFAARLQAMGIDPDRAFDDDNDGPRTFMGVDLATLSTSPNPKDAA